MVIPYYLASYIVQFLKLGHINIDWPVLIVHSIMISSTKVELSLICMLCPSFETKGVPCQGTPHHFKSLTAASLEGNMSQGES